MNLPSHWPLCVRCNRPLYFLSRDDAEKAGLREGWRCLECNAVYNVERGGVIGQLFSGFEPGAIKSGTEFGLRRDEVEDFQKFCSETGQPYASYSDIIGFSPPIRKSIIENFRKWKEKG